jgi:cell division protein FtsB
MARLIKSVESQKLYEKLLGPLLLAIGIFYLIFHALSGERGIYALLKEERKLEMLQTELHNVVGQRKDMEHKVRLMSSGSLDLDLLDEQTRIILGSAGEKEMVIPLK